MSSHNCNEIWNKILLNWNKTFIFGRNLFKSDQNFMSSHNCNAIRNKTPKNGTKYCVEILKISLLKEEQNF